MYVCACCVKEDIKTKMSVIMQKLNDIMTPEASSSSFTTTALVTSTDDQDSIEVKMQGEF